VPNGVDFDSFHVQSPSTQRPAVLNKIPDPFLLYTGMIDSRLDINLIRLVALRLPQISFVFAGPSDNTQVLRDLPANIFFIGPVEHASLRELMNAAVAGMIPFDVKNQMDIIQGIRPLKLLEYLAAGLPVITAKWPELEKMKSPAWFYDDETDFVALVRKAITEGGDSTAAWTYAKRFDWEQAYHKMLSFI
jgi:glycosyltransferase involved in cell wall biosynthesis